MEAASYDTQLAFIEELLADNRRWLEVESQEARKIEHILLSIAESIKTARDHNLNCRKVD